MTSGMPEFVMGLVQICQRPQGYIFKLNYSLVFYMSIDELYHD
jgi:hypothetical protein